MCVGCIDACACAPCVCAWEGALCRLISFALSFSHHRRRTRRRHPPMFCFSFPPRSLRVKWASIPALFCTVHSFVKSHSTAAPLGPPRAAQASALNSKSEDARERIGGDDKFTCTVLCVRTSYMGWAGMAGLCPPTPPPLCLEGTHSPPPLGPWPFRHLGSATGHREHQGGLKWMHAC